MIHKIRKYSLCRLECYILIKTKININNVYKKCDYHSFYRPAFVFALNRGRLKHFIKSNTGIQLTCHRK